MRLGGTRCRAGAGGALDRAEVEPSRFGDAFEPRQNISGSAHVAGLFLNPDNLARVRMLLDGSDNLRARQRVELVKKENRGVRILAAAAFGPQLVAHFSAGDQDAAGVGPLAGGDPPEGARPPKIPRILTGGPGGPHSLWREEGQPPCPPAAAPAARAL